jgi:hypothetical protein
MATGGGRYRPRNAGGADAAAFGRRLALKCETADDVGVRVALPNRVAAERFCRAYLGRCGPYADRRTGVRAGLEPLHRAVTASGSNQAGRRGRAVGHPDIVTS